MKIYALVFKESACHGHGDYTTETILGSYKLWRSKEAAERYYEANARTFYGVPHVIELTLEHV